jgi:hypothetical protein
MAFEYPRVIYFDANDDDSDISLEQTNLKQNPYTMTDRGSSGVVYVNSSLTLCIKLIVYPVLNDDSMTEELTQKYETEVRLQSISSDVGFAPIIHRHFQTQITINEKRYDVYVIVMEYLNPSEWRNIPPNELTQAMIKSFVETTGLYNDEDPYNHFYQRTNREGKQQIFMIDYGRVKECIDQKPKLSVPNCIDKMWSKFKQGGTKPLPVKRTAAFKKPHNPHPKYLPIIDDIFQPKLDARVSYYTSLLNRIEWNEDKLFPLLCELYWETASDPQLNKRKLLIINVFNTTLKRFEMSVRDAMNHIFYTLSNSAVKDGEQIISLLFLKFILYFATFILNKEPSEESLCDSLSHLIGLVGSTDGENILNGGTGSIAAFLKNTRQLNEVHPIIVQIHKILTDLSIAVPDTISIQSIIPKICRFRIQQLCPGGVTDSEDDDMGEERQLPPVYSGKNNPPTITTLMCPYHYKCNRKRLAKDGDKYHFDKFRHPPNFIHIEDRRPKWRPGGGSGKSKRTRRSRRTLSSKRIRRTRTTRRR